MNEKKQVWYGVIVDDDPTEIWYGSPDLSYVQKKVEWHINRDVRRGKNHKYEIVNLGEIDA